MQLLRIAGFMAVIPSPCPLRMCSRCAPALALERRGQGSLVDDVLRQFTALAKGGCTCMHDLQRELVLGSLRADWLVAKGRTSP